MGILIGQEPMRYCDSKLIENCCCLLCQGQDLHTIQAFLMTT